MTSSKKTTKKATEKLPKVKTVTSAKELPTVYVGFTDDLEAAMKIMKDKEPKFLERGYRPVKPYDVYRLVTTSNTYEWGKKKKKVKRLQESVMLAFALEEV